MALPSLLSLLLPLTLLAPFTVGRDPILRDPPYRDHRYPDPPYRDPQRYPEPGRRGDSCSRFSFEHAYASFPMVTGPRCQKVEVVRSVLGCGDVVEHVCTGLCEDRQQCCEGVGPWTATYYIQGEAYYAKRFTFCRCRYF